MAACDLVESKDTAWSQPSPRRRATCRIQLVEVVDGKVARAEDSHRRGPASPLSKRLIEKISNIRSRGDERPKLRKSMSLDDLQERAVFSGINVDPRMKTSRDLLLERGVRNTTRFEDRSGPEIGSGKPESKSNSSVKKMISVLEGTSPSLKGSASETDVSHSHTDSGSMQAGKAVVPFVGDNNSKGSNYQSGKTVVLFQQLSSLGLQGSASETGVSHSHTDSGSMQAGKAVVPFVGDNNSKGSNDQSGKTAVLFQHKPGQAGTPNAAAETRRGHRSSGRGGASKQKQGENELRQTKRRSQAKHRSSKSIGSSYYSLEQMSLRDNQLNYLVATSSTWIHPHVCVTSASRQLKELLVLEHLNSVARVREGTQQQEQSRSNGDNDESIASARTPSGRGFQMLNGWLVNQGVRAAIVVIACGALLVNNR